MTLSKSADWIPLWCLTCTRFSRCFLLLFAILLCFWWMQIFHIFYALENSWRWGCVVDWVFYIGFEITMKLFNYFWSQFLCSTRIFNFTKIKFYFSRAHFLPIFTLKFNPIIISQNQLWKLIFIPPRYFNFFQFSFPFFDNLILADYLAFFDFTLITFFFVFSEN